MKQGIFVSEGDRQILMRLLTECINIDLLKPEERDRFVVIVQTVALACPPKPVGLEENIGSCEPSPLILWDQTGTTWHTETRAGRYSVQCGTATRTGSKPLWRAYLNNNLIAMIRPSRQVDAVKCAVEDRIRSAKTIARIGEKL